MTPKVPSRYLKLREMASVDSVSLGYASIRLAAATELRTAQQGYSDLPEGAETDWKTNWLVVGNEGMCGDPIFIDTSVDSYPVYTAIAGMGEWTPRLIAPSFDSFLKILEDLNRLAKGRSNPVALERHPISDEERRTFLDTIGCDAQDFDESFWRVLLQ